MKKQFLCIMALSLGLNAVPARAADAAPTQKRGLVEFSELYTYRFTSGTGIANFDYDIRENISDAITATEYYFGVSMSAGTLLVDKQTLEIAYAEFLLTDTAVGDEENEMAGLSAIAAFSALEFSAYDDGVIYWKSTIDGGVSDSYEQSVEIFDEKITPILIESGFRDAFNGEEVGIYTGNYSYHVEFRTYTDTVTNDTHNQYWIIADEIR